VHKMVFVWKSFLYFLVLHEFVLRTNVNLQCVCCREDEFDEYFADMFL